MKNRILALTATLGFSLFFVGCKMMVKGVANMAGVPKVMYHYNCKLALQTELEGYAGKRKSIETPAELSRILKEKKGIEVVSNPDETNFAGKLTLSATEQCGAETAIADGQSSTTFSGSETPARRVQNEALYKEFAESAKGLELNRACLKSFANVEESILFELIPTCQTN